MAAINLDQSAVVAEPETMCRDQLDQLKVPKRILFADPATRQGL